MKTEKKKDSPELEDRRWMWCWYRDATPMRCDGVWKRGDGRGEVWWREDGGVVAVSSMRPRGGDRDIGAER